MPKNKVMRCICFGHPSYCPSIKRACQIDGGWRRRSPLPIADISRHFGRKNIAFCAFQSRQVLEKPEKMKSFSSMIFQHAGLIYKESEF